MISKVETTHEEIKLSKSIVAPDDHIIYALPGGVYPIVITTLAHKINALIS